MQTRMRLFVGAFCLLVLLLVSFLGFARSDQSQQVPAPQISTTTNLTAGEGYALGISQGTEVNANWCVRNLTQPGDNATDWQGNLFSYLDGSWYMYDANLGSMYPTNGSGTPSSDVYIDCSGTLIPIYLYNCSSFDMTTSNITYVDKVPTFNNTIAFHNIQMETHGQGNSSITLTFTQTFIANWTEFTIRTDTFADLSNLKLYTDNGSELSENSPFSINFNYNVALFNQTKVNLHQDNITDCVLQPHNVTSTEAFYTITGVGELQYSLANMTFADSYVESQGNTQIAGNNVTSGLDANGGHLLQTFDNLTYNLTTSIESDPTIVIQHDSLVADTSTSSPTPSPSSSSSSSTSSSSSSTSTSPSPTASPTIPEIPALPMVGVAILAITVLVVAAVHTKKKRTHNQIIPTQLLRDAQDKA